MNFGALLRQERKSRKITLRELAKYTRQSIGYLSDIERGRRTPPRLETVLKIEEYFDMDNDRLFRLATEQRRIHRLILRARRKIANYPKMARVILAADEDLTDEQYEIIMAQIERMKGENDGKV